jgi:hypothetical protein
MNLLTDNEIAKCWLSIPDPIALGGQFQENQDIRYFANAIIAATIDKLAAGVNVDPVGYLSEHTCDGVWKYQFNKERAGVYKDNAITIDRAFTQDQLTTAIAAARVAALEEAAIAADLFCNGGESQRPLKYPVAAAIRALIGAKT